MCGCDYGFWFHLLFGAFSSRELLLPECWLYWWVLKISIIRLYYVRCMLKNLINCVQIKLFIYCLAILINTCRKWRTSCILISTTMWRDRRDASMLESVARHQTATNSVEIPFRWDGSHPWETPLQITLWSGESAATRYDMSGRFLKCFWKLSRPEIIMQLYHVILNFTFTFPVCKPLFYFRLSADVRKCWQYWWIWHGRKREIKSCNFVGCCFFSDNTL